MKLLTAVAASAALLALTSCGTASPGTDSPELTSSKIMRKLHHDFGSAPFAKHVQSVDSSGGTLFVQLPADAPRAETMAACVAVRRMYTQSGADQPSAISVMAGRTEAVDALAARNDGKCQAA